MTTAIRIILVDDSRTFLDSAGALLDAIPRDDLVFIPHVSSVQLAFARVKETWHDARVVSR